MAKLLMIVSSARTIRLADGRDHPTGYRVEEVRKPHEPHSAWRRNIDFIEVLAEDDQVPSRLSVERVKEIRDEVWQASRARAQSAAEALAKLPGWGWRGKLKE